MIPLNEDDQIKFNEKRYTYVILNKDNSQKEFPHLNISQKLSIKITEVDADGEEEGSYEEEYTNVWDLVITTKDYLGPSVIMKSFKECWEALGMQGQRDGTLSELNQTFQLPFKSMQLAVKGVNDFFGSMTICENSNKVDVTQKFHTLLMSG
jgi:hypothetical protein